MSQLFDSPTGGFIGKTDYHLMSDHEAAIIRANDKLVMDTGDELETVEIVHVGDVKWHFLVSKFRVSVRDKRFLGVFGMLFDVEKDDVETAARLASERLKNESQPLRIRLYKLAEKVAS